MFVGHLALALAAKRGEPRLSLGALVAATMGIDLLWPVLLLAGVERVRVDPGNTAFTPLAFDAYPWSHSLAATATWAALAGAAAWGFTRRRGPGIVVFLLVLSHWALDALTHRPDLPLLPVAGSRLVGLGLWNSVPATIAIEGAMFAAGIALYARGTRPLDRTGTTAFVAFVVLMGAIWIAGPFGPPPPSASAVAWVGLATWLLPLWAAWFDRKRGLAPLSKRCQSPFPI